MKDLCTNQFVDVSKKVEKEVREASDLFAKLSPEAQDRIIDLIKSLLSKK